MDQDNSELAKLIKEKSYKVGEFTLASGQRSSFYLDLKSTTLDPKGIYLVGRAMAKIIVKSKAIVQGLSGLSIGADPLITATSLAGFELGIHWPGLLIRKEAKSHGTGNLVEGKELLRRGDNVAILEDVATTGGSSLQAIESVRSEGFNVPMVICIVDREQGAREKFEAMGIAFYSLFKVRDIQKA